MTLKLYNTLTRKKEEFIPLDKDEITLYTCGPTVYNYVHIGNLRAMLAYDLLKRYLKYKGLNVKHVMNITDVDDKTIRDSQKEKKTLKEFTEFYSKAFFDDIKALNVDLPKITPKATDEIDQMVEIIKILLDKGYAYKNEKGDIYFSIAKYEKYGELANIDHNTLKENANGRLNNADEYEKDDAKDFALWKAYDKDDGDVYWDTEIGKGRPGWHIECSAMSSKYLGQPFDIHMGGVDLIFPHHTNEIAQSEAAFEKKFCNYWVHNEHLLVNGEKMSKSKGNFYTLKDLLEKGYRPRAIRYELISTHYRQQLDFREDNLKKIPEILQRFDDFLLRLDEIIKKDTQKDQSNIFDDIIEKSKQEFIEGMDDDLNISKGLATIFDFMNKINKNQKSLDANSAKKAKETFLGFDKVLGVTSQEEQNIPEEIIELAKSRTEAKKAKDYDKADKIRDKINEKGYAIEDTKDGYRIKNRQKI